MTPGGRGSVRNSQGISLVEVVVFIVIVSAAAVALLGALGRVVPKGASAAQLTVASQLAQERMELIAGQRAVLGYSSLQLDPCTQLGTQIPCQALGGMSVVATGINPVVGWSGLSTNSYRQVTVDVNGPTGSLLVREVTVFSSY